MQWIDGVSNFADVMTKANFNKILQELIDINKLKVKIKGWV